MKLKKFLSLMLMADDRFGFTSDHPMTKEDQESFLGDQYNQLKELEAVLKEEGYDFKSAHPILPEGKETVRIKCLDKQGNPIVAQVEATPIGIDPQAPDKIHYYTNREGVLELDLPRYTFGGYEKGHIGVEEILGYIINVSKGSLYKTYSEDIIFDSAEENMELTFMMEPWIDLDDFHWIAGDFHHHSVYSSPLHGGTDDVDESADQVSWAMEAAGLSYGLSDHHNIYNHKDWLATEYPGFMPIPSKEISTTNGHVMSMNCLEDVIYRIPSKEERTQAYLFEEFVRIVEDIKDQNGLAQINHPMDLQQAISLSPYMKNHVDLFETMEIWNGSVPMDEGYTNGEAYKFWLSKLGEGLRIPATGGSDTHNTKADDYIIVLNWVRWFIYHLQLVMDKKILNDRQMERAQDFMSLVDKTLEPLSLWAKEKLGTGCVHTYIHRDKSLELTKAYILDMLKKGRSFVSNGPVIVPKNDQWTYGQEINWTSEEMTFSYSVMTNEPLAYLDIVGKKGLIDHIDVSGLPPSSERY